MSRRLFRMCIPPFAAVLLIAALVLGVEYWLRGQRLVTQVVTAQAELSVQGLLQPSGECHHELRAGRVVRLEQADGDVVSVRINAEGLRGEAVAVGTESSYRILVLGDDVVFGGWLPESKTLPGQLKSLFADRTQMQLEVLNGGVPGYCPLLSGLRFRGLRELRPDLVIVHVDMSDVDDDAVYRGLTSERGGRVVCVHPSERQVTPGPQLPLPGWLQRSALFERSVLAMRHDVPPLLAVASQASGQQRFAWISDRGGNRKLEIEHALQPLADLRRDVESLGARLLVSTCPVVWQVVDGRRVAELSRRCQIRGATPCGSREPFLALAEFCARERIRLVDASDQFRAWEEPLELFSLDSPVPSARGLGVYAAAIADYIVRNPPREWDVEAAAGGAN